MGVAIPLALANKINNTKKINLVYHLLVRSILLGCFALIIQQIKWLTVSKASPAAAIFVLMVFAACILIYSNSGLFLKKPLHKLWHVSAAITLAVLIIYLPYAKWLNVVPNSKLQVDIIIMVLANVSFSAGILYIFFNKSDLNFWLVYLFLIVFFCLGKLTNSQFSECYNYSPLPLFFKWDYHKYILIVWPGVYVGKQLLRKTPNEKNHPSIFVAIAIFIFIGAILYGLLSRNSFIVWLIALVFFSIFYFTVIYKLSPKATTFKLFVLVAVFFMAGLLLEPTQGGIKKDSCTFSYLLLTPALATLVLFAFKILNNYSLQQSWYNKLLYYPLHFFEGVGANALGGYEMGKFLVWPIMILTGTKFYFDTATYSQSACFIRGLIYTLVACSFTYVFNRFKLNWKA
jgi:hypothetical protein